MALLGDSVGLLFRIKADGDQAIREMNRVQRSLGTEIKAIEAGFNSLGTRLGASEAQMAGLGRMVPVVATGFAALAGGAVALGVASVRAATELESLKRGLAAVSGGTAAAEAQLVRLREVAKLPGLSFRDAIEGSIRLQAAGVSAELAERALKGFGNALATVGKGATELEGVTRALSQIQSKGKVMAQEINQLAERLPQIRVLMQAAFGTSIAKEVEKLGLTTNEFLRRMVEQLEKLPQVTGSAKTSFENLEDAVFVALAAIGKEMLPPVLKAVEDLTKGVEGNGKAWRQLGQDMGEAVKTSVGVIKFLSDVSKWLNKIEEMKMSWAARIVSAMYGVAPHAMVGIDAAAASLRGQMPTAPYINPHALPGEQALYNRPGPPDKPYVDPDAEKKAERAERERQKALLAALKHEQEVANMTLEALQAHHAQKLELEEIYQKQRLRLIERWEEEGRITHELAERSRQAETSKTFVMRIEMLEAEIAKGREVHADNAEIFRLQNELKTISAERDAFVAERQARVTDAIKRDTEARLENLNATLAQLEARKKLAEDESSPALPDPSGLPDIIKDINAPDPLPPPDPGPWVQFKEIVAGALGDVQTRGQIMYDTLSSLFSGLGQGAQQMVQGFLLGGKLSAKAFAEMAKGAIAAVTAEAAVRALFELAMGFASLWLAPQKAAAHFTAAKIFGAVAAMGAIAVAGLSLGGGSASAGGAMAGGMQNADEYAGGSNRRPGADPNDKTIRDNRMVIEVRVDTEATVRRIADNYQGAGALRNVIRGDILGEPA